MITGAEEGVVLGMGGGGLIRARKPCGSANPCSAKALALIAAEAALSKVRRDRSSCAIPPACSSVTCVLSETW